jgi:hypothetical protein
MRPHILIAASALTVLALVACQSNAVSGSNASPSSTGVTVPSGGAFTDPAYSAQYPVDGNEFDPANFDADSAEVDNRWFPLEPGTHYIWEGHAFEDGERVERRVEFIVTDLTKVIGGVRAVVGWDRDFNDDLLGESELIFYAQDKFGTVWHLGEYVEHWKEEGELDGGRLWIVGDPPGAEAGIGMHADPQVRTGEYSQGFAPPPWFCRGRRGRPRELCPRRLLRRRDRDQGVRAAVPGDLPAQVLRPGRRKHPRWMEGIQGR